jgi:tetratricopeptide (TPR) repeat protein
MAFYEQKFADAVMDFTLANKLSPGDGIVEYNLADSLLQDGDAKSALDLYIKINNNSQELRYKVGKAYLYLGDYSEAIKRLSTVATQSVLEGHRGKARVAEAAAYVEKSESDASPEQRQKDLEAASTQLSEGVAADPTYWRDVLVTTVPDKHEGYDRERRLLAQVSKSVFGTSK